MSGNSTKSIALCALCIALLVTSSLFTIPLGPVPFTLQTLVIVLIVLLLTPAQAVATIGVYLLMGAVGLPVFSAMSGGLGKLLGPTGGFLFAYLVIAICIPNLRIALMKRIRRPLVTDGICAFFVLLISYLMGWGWLMVVASMGPQAAFLAAVAPFIVVDCLKAALAIIIVQNLRRALKHPA